MGRIEISTGSLLKDWKRVLPGLIISIAALGFVLYLANPRQLVAALQMANLRVLVLGLLISLTWLLVRTLVWRTLLQYQATLGQTFLTINEGYLLNNILPFRLGEVGRAFLLSQKTDLGFWHVLSTIMIERILDMALAVGLLLVTIPFVAGASWAREAAMGAGALVATAFIALYLLARNRTLAAAWLQKLSLRWPILKKLVGEKMNTFFDGLAVLNRSSLFLAAVGFMLLNWVVAIFQYYVLLLAFVPQAQILWAAFSLGVAALGVAAPSSPGAVGVMELSLVGALTVFGIDPAISLAFALCTHLMGYVTSGLIGSYALARDGESLTGLYARIRRLPQKTTP